jgi:phospholipase/carboxylesterase
MQRLDGPRLHPASGVTPDSLVVLLHGYGSDGADLIALGEMWSRRLPATAFVAPNAPERLPHAAMSGYQWFPLTLRDPSEYAAGVEAMAPVLDHFLNQELDRHRIPPSRLALVGFSQGTMMALHVGLRRNSPPAIILGYSGLLATPQALPACPTGAPEIVLVHGDRDDVLPVEHLNAAREALAARGYAVSWHVRPGLGHGIDEAGLHFGAKALQQVFRPSA